MVYTSAWSVYEYRQTIQQWAQPGRPPAQEFRFEGDEVMIAKIDDMVILYPREKAWDLLARSLDRFTDDFMAERPQPEKPDKRRRL